MLAARLRTAPPLKLKCLRVASDVVSPMDFPNARSGDAIGIHGAADTLRQLERQDWWRWAAAVIVTFLLTFGVFALSLPGLKRGIFEQAQLDVSLAALCANQSVRRL